MIERCVLMGLLLMAGASSAATLHVNPDGSGDYPTIQAAVDAAVTGDTIELGDGVFRGPGNRKVEIRNKGVTLRSASGDPSLCVLDCEGSASEPNWGLWFDQEFGVPGDLLVEGITIEHAYDEPEFRGAADGSAITSECQTITIRNCIIRANGGGSALGLAAVCTGEASRIESCLVTGNSAADPGGVGALLARGSLDIVSSTFSGNFGTVAGAMGISFGQFNFERTILWGNCSADGAIDELYVSDASASFVCTIVDTTGLDHLSSVITFESSVFEDPDFCDPEDCAGAPTTGGDYTVSSASPALPGASPCGMLIGALGQGCTGNVPVRDIGWGRLKQLFRD